MENAITVEYQSLRRPGTSHLPALYPALSEQAGHEVPFWSHTVRVASGLTTSFSLVAEGRLHRSSRVFRTYCKPFEKDVRADRSSET